jgi:protein SCO1
MRWILCALLMLGAAATGAATTLAAAAPLPRDSIYQLDAPLIDQAGHALHLADKRGKAQLAVMFYTSCTFTCPTMIETLQDLDRKLAADERQRLGVLMISLDPERDDAAALKSTADRRHVDLGRWTLAQPRPTDVRAIAGLLGVRYRRLANGEFNHTAALVLLDADGRIVARSDKTSGAADPAFVAHVRSVLMTPP